MGHYSGMGDVYGEGVDPVERWFINACGETLAQGDVLRLDVLGATAGADFTAQPGTPTHPLSRLADFDQGVTLGSDQFARSFTYVVQHKALSPAVLNLGKFRGLIQGYLDGLTELVNVFITAAELALGAPAGFSYGIQNGQTQLKTLRLTASSNETVRLWSKSAVTVGDANSQVGGLYVGTPAGLGAFHA